MNNFSNPRYIDPDNKAILVDNSETGVPKALIVGHPLYDSAVSGTFGEVAPYVEPEIIVSSNAVDAESEKRMTSGFTFSVDGVDYVFQSDSKSLARITGAATLAGFAVAQGASAGNRRWHGGTSDFSWITEDNSVIQMDAPTTFALGQAAAANESAHIFAGKALKDMDPIPLDYKEDTYWP